MLWFGGVSRRNYEGHIISKEPSSSLLKSCAGQANHFSGFVEFHSKPLFTEAVDLGLESWHGPPGRHIQGCSAGQREGLAGPGSGFSLVLQPHSPPGPLLLPALLGGMRGKLTVWRWRELWQGL